MKNQLASKPTLRPLWLSVGVWSAGWLGAMEIGLARIAIGTPLAPELAQLVLAIPQLPNAAENDGLTTAQPVSAVSPLADDIYTLGAGDTINVEIFNVPEYSGSQRLLADGSVNLAAVGSVTVGGLTPQEAERAIAAAYEGELRYPRVTVLLEMPRPLRVAIAGEVSSPGSYTLTPEGAQLPTVSQALQLAGGVTQAADLQRVELRRTNGDRLEQTVMLDLWQLLNGGDMQQDLALRDGDILIIHETDTVDLAAANQLSASNLSTSTTQEIVIAVVGEVSRPGAYEFAGSSEDTGRTTVTQVIQTAGGIRPSADIKRIQVRRLARSGDEQLIGLDFWKLLNEGDLTQDLILQQGDTVIVPVADSTTPSETAQLTAANLSPGTVQVNVVGEVANPGMISISPNTTLNQAVLAAGGFTARSTETVELIRLNPNGSVSQRQIEVDLREGIDSERNPLILNNDVVLVGRNSRARLSDSVGGIFQPILQLLSPLQLLF